MTVENDGLPSTETAAHQPDDAQVPGGVGEETLDPPTDLLPLDAATAKRVAAGDAAARRADMNTPAASAPPTAPLPSIPPTAADQAVAEPVDPQATPEEPGAAHGSMAGDLFDGQADR
ncbi:MAG TPA: hypothetical protein VH969_29665 [Actinophytocola sp.]|jgi:hypothetical protein|uniref:hypothetical protein n=1 Tax=Actinophytocola sp. TaxID=1872138 RepID=UPI002F929453